MFAAILTPRIYFPSWCLMTSVLGAFETQKVSKLHYDVRRIRHGTRAEAQCMLGRVARLLGIESANDRTASCSGKRSQSVHLYPPDVNV